MDFPSRSQFRNGDSRLSAAHKETFDCYKLTDKEKELLCHEVLFEDAKDPDILLNAKAVEPPVQTAADLHNEVKFENESEDDEFRCEGTLNAADLLDSEEDESHLLFNCLFMNCPYAYNTYEELEEHMNIHSDTQIFACDVCKKRFFLKAAAMAHIQAREKMECCGCKKKFSNDCHFVEHLRRHTGEKPFICHSCGQGFARLVILNNHMLSHTEDKPFPCGLCKKSFATKEYLKKHERRHSGEKLYTCGYCDYRCDDSSSMSRHNRIHTGEKPFSCGYCGKRFALTNDLRAHERVHTGEKPFECKDCGKRFSQKGNLNLHISLHIGEKPFSCKECDKKFANNVYLRKHIKNMHSK